MEHSSSSLRRCNHLMMEIEAVYHEVSVRLGLADSVEQILYTICQFDSEYRCPLKVIRTRTGLSKQTANSALRKLEREGIVYLEPSGGKGKDVCLTPQGIALAERTVSKIIAAENAVLASWPEEDVEAYLTLLEKYLVAFRQEAKKYIC